jgi:hypothetical protein
MAERAVKDVELSIGGQRIDKHYQLWWRLYAELYLDDAKKAGWGKLTSSPNPAGNSGSRQVFLPLIFFFNRNPGLFLPLIALQYHEVRLDFDLSSDFSNYFTTTVKVWGNYVYLDTEERRRFAQKGHEYLIEQVQHTGTDTITGSGQVRLSFNHPVKELVWCYNSGTFSNAGSWLFCTPNNTANAGAVVLTTDVSSDADATTNVMTSSITEVGAPVVLWGGSNGSTSIWGEELTPVAGACAGPLNNFKLILNGQDRFKEQSGKYFNQVQPHNHHSGSPYPGVYCYSFALKPEEHQPTGTCNFSRIDNAQVQVNLKAGAITTTQHMFAVNYNVLRIQSGMGGLAFSN